MADLWSPRAIARPAPSRPNSIAGVAPRACPHGPRPTSLTGRPSPARHGKNAISTDVSCSILRRNWPCGLRSFTANNIFPTALTCSVRRLASMAMEAHDLLCSYAPQVSSRIIARRLGSGRWRVQQVARRLRRTLRARTASSAMSRLPLELISLLQEDSIARPPLRIAGFDRMLPTQRRLFDAWGSWQQFQPEGPTSRRQVSTPPATARPNLSPAPSGATQQLATNPQAASSSSRRICRNAAAKSNVPSFASAARAPLPSLNSRLAFRSARFHWHGRLCCFCAGSATASTKTQLDWLFSSGLAASPEESAALQACMRTLRRSRPAAASMAIGRLSEPGVDCGCTASLSGSAA